MDRISKEARSRLMGRIRGDELGPETRVFKAATGWGLSPERNAKDLPGKPDLVFRGERVAVFVHGCFWHGCPSHFRVPKTRSEHWAEHVRKNRARDRRDSRTLASLGWVCVRLWEHSVRDTLGATFAIGKKVLPVFRERGGRL